MQLGFDIWNKDNEMKFNERNHSRQVCHLDTYVHLS